MSETLKMQQQVIAVLHSALLGGHLDMNNLASAANSRTDNTISVLNNQYQRMAVAAPIRRPIKPKPRPLPLRRPQLCQEAQRLLICPSSTPRYKPQRLLPDPKNPARFGRECPSCSSTWNDRPVGLIRDPASKLRYPSDFQFRCHTPVDEIYLCYLCGPDSESPVMDGHAELMAHLRTHSQADLLRPGKISPPESVVDEEYERAWMPSEWKGGYVEEKSLPNSPRAAFLKGFAEGKSAPPSPALPNFNRGGSVDDKSAPNSPTPSARHNDYFQHRSPAPASISSYKKVGYMDGKSAPTSPTLGMRPGEFVQHPSPLASSIQSHKRGSSWNGNPAPCTPEGKGNSHRGWKSAENSPAGSVGGYSQGQGQSAPTSPRGGHRCVCGAG